MMPRAKAARRLVLLGGGHAHVHLLAQAARAPLAPPGELELTLVSPYERHLYSGMVPGYLQGIYAETDLTFDLRALAARAGARFITAKADRIDAAARRVEVAGERLPYDLLSLDVGSEPAGLETSGVREHALTVRPMNRAAALRRRAEELFASGAADRVEVAVVGGGAAGVEVAFALERLGRERAARVRVTIVEAATDVVPEFSRRVQGIAGRLLAARGIAVCAGRPVAAVEAASVVLDDGRRLPSQLTVWIAGAAAPRLLAESDLPKDPDGFLLVDATLRAVDGGPLFGAGDCIGIAGYPGLAKAGVYAVREAPILDHNLRAALAGTEPRRFRPQAGFLALLNSADGRAIWRWKGLAGHSRLAWRLKDRLDRAFLRRYPEAR
ncbi:MAG: FAD-dependent oxidoreductase [Thermoanaerobaculia bacterium]|nr:FAD-dependent oxidoreductase [Thermoanaerobaculia bacterium]MBP9822946.1 FAD-dependent oxidoreductase [Thermoanaerobaculia bacterium]